MIITKKIEGTLVSNNFFPAIRYWNEMGPYLVILNLNCSMMKKLSISPENALTLNVRPHLDRLCNSTLLEKCEFMSIFLHKLKSLLGFSKKLPFEAVTPSLFSDFRYNLLLESYALLYEFKFAELSAREL
jgi:hypothetical protein